MPGISEVWSSGKPELVEAVNQYHEDLKSFDEKARAFAERIDKGQTPLIGRDFNGRLYVSGLSVNGGELLPGWRKHNNQIAQVPYRNTRAGRELAIEMDAIECKALATPGMPNHWLGARPGGIMMIRPIMQRIRDRVYVPFGYPVEDEIVAQFDTAIWEKTKLSEFYRVCEEEGVVIR